MASNTRHVLCLISYVGRDLGLVVTTVLSKRLRERHTGRTAERVKLSFGKARIGRATFRVVCKPGSGRDQATNNNVFLQSAQGVSRAANPIAAPFHGGFYCPIEFDGDVELID